MLRTNAFSIMNYPSVTYGSAAPNNSNLSLPLLAPLKFLILSFLIAINFFLCYQRKCSSFFQGGGWIMWNFYIDIMSLIDFCLLVFGLTANFCEFWSKLLNFSDLDFDLDLDLNLDFFQNPDLITTCSRSLKPCILITTT